MAGCIVPFGLIIVFPSEQACNTFFNVVTHQLKTPARGRIIELETCGLCKKL